MAKRVLNSIISSRWLPWALVGLLLLVIWHVVFLPASDLSNNIRLVQPLLFIFGLVSIAGIILIFNYISRLNAERASLQDRLAGAEQNVGDAYQRLEAIFQISQKFVEANDENEVIEPILYLLLSFSGADGVSFVPLDEHGQPQAALSQGELPASVMQSWAEHLASAQVRERCKNCGYLNNTAAPTSCPLLTGPFSTSRQMLCMPVRRGEREYGILNLYLSQDHVLDDRTRVYLRALVDEVALRLESIHLRRRELSALRQMQVLRQRTDLSALLGGLLENVYRTLDADFAVMVVPRGSQYLTRIDLTLGDFASQIRPFIDGILQGVMASKEPVLLGEVSGDQQNGAYARPFVRSLIAVPLLSTEQEVLGAAKAI